MKEVAGRAAPRRDRHSLQSGRGIVTIALTIAILSGILVMAMPHAATDIAPATTRTTQTEAYDPAQRALPTSIPTSDPVHAVPPTGWLNATSRSSGDSSIYWVGEEYHGIANHVTSVQTTITTPNGTPDSSDSFFVILSIYDGSSAYDQIGLMATIGGWYGVWSVGPNCPTPSGYYDVNSVSLLQPDSQYTFQMRAYPNGTIFFGGTVGPTVTGAWQWTGWYHTGGTYFEEQSSYYCGGLWYNDYTDYEEIHALVEQCQPNWDFMFTDNEADGSPVTSWSGLYYNLPSCIGSVYAGSFNDVVSIRNEWFSIAVNPCAPDSGYCEFGVTPGTVASIVGSLFDWPPSCGCPASVSLSLYISLPTGWTWVFSPSNLVPPGSYTLQVGIPSSAPSGAYLIGIKASWGGQYTTFRFSVAIPSGGGGGCVAWGTPILTPAGYVAVQDLSSGDSIMEYDFQNQTLVQGTFTSGNATEATLLEDINDGWLYVTPTDQPIFVENATFIGWLRDPQNLTTLDKVFDPVTQSWVQVTGVTFVHHHVQVFDVVTTGYNNFVANGALLDRKA